MKDRIPFKSPGFEKDQSPEPNSFYKWLKA